MQMSLVHVARRGKSTRLHFPHSVSTIDGTFLLDAFLLRNHLGNVSLDLIDLDPTRNLSLEVLNSLLENLIILVVDNMCNVEVGSVGTTSTQTIFSRVIAGGFEKSAKVLELAGAQFEMVLQALDDSSSGGTELLCLDEGQP
jgi:hypothetical protein